MGGNIVNILTSIEHIQLLESFMANLISLQLHSEIDGNLQHKSYKIISNVFIVITIRNGRPQNTAWKLAADVTNQDRANQTQFGMESEMLRTHPSGKRLLQLAYDRISNAQVGFTNNSQFNLHQNFISKRQFQNNISRINVFKAFLFTAYYQICANKIKLYQVFLKNSLSLLSLSFS